MPSEPLFLIPPFVGALGLFDALILYASYLSLSVWRGLAVPLYKSRAFWMALFGIPLAIAISYSGVSYLLLAGDSLLSVQPISDILFTVPLITLFVWIDRMVSSVIRLDYLRRDVLYWKRLRIIYWILVFLANVLYFSRYIFGPFPGILSIPSTTVPLAYGSLCLFVGTRSTRDSTFRSYIKWFGFLGAVLVPGILVYTLTSDLILVSPVLIAIAFCFYRMARFLVPIGRFSAS